MLPYVTGYKHRNNVADNLFRYLNPTGKTTFSASAAILPVVILTISSHYRVSGETTLLADAVFSEPSFGGIKT